MTKVGYYHKENADEFVWLCVNLNLVKIQFFIIWKFIEAKLLHRL